MVELDDPRWSELAHAYGPASDIPALLRTLAASPASARDVGAEPWFSLWSCLCHQDDVYTASYAAVPHIVEIAMGANGPIDLGFFLLPAAIEVSRAGGRGPDLPDDLETSYSAAMVRLMDVVARHRHDDWDEATLISALAAQAAAKGHYELARALISLDGDMIARINAQEFYSDEE